MAADIGRESWRLPNAPAIVTHGLKQWYCDDMYKLSSPPPSLSFGKIDRLNAKHLSTVERNSHLLSFACEAQAAGALPLLPRFP